MSQAQAIHELSPTSALLILKLEPCDIHKVLQLCIAHWIVAGARGMDYSAECIGVECELR